MFGLFKKKISKRDDQFITDLAIAASDFQHGISWLDSNTSEELSERALESHFVKDSETSQFSASDSLINELVYAIAKPTLDGQIDPMVSWGFYTEVEEFLNFNNKYNSDLAIEFMGIWYGALSKVGAFDN